MTASTDRSEPPLIEVRALEKRFPVRGGKVLGGPQGWLKAVDGVSFTIGQGETLSLVGETGCGKTTTARMVLMVEKATGGDILFRGKSIRDFDAVDRRQYRSSVQAVFQDPWSSLNPRMRIEDIVSEPLTAVKRVTKAEVRRRVDQLLVDVGLPLSARRRYPHEFSGGQRQRIAIARALSSDPSLIVLDEPVSALDVSIRAQIVNLLKDLQARMGVSYLMIAHHLALVRHMSHRVSVMYLGKVVEDADPSSLFAHPMHPYTKALIAASLPNHPDIDRGEIILTGEVPSPLSPPSGCRFHPRCWLYQQLGEPERCRTEEPVIQDVDPAHAAACHFARDVSLVAAAEEQVAASAS